MNTFNADFSSSPGSDRLPKNTPQQRKLFFAPSEPSTTPAAPPPSTLFGSSRHGSAVSKFQWGRERASSSNPRLFNIFPPDGSATFDQPKTQSFQYSTNSMNTDPTQGYSDDGMEEYSEDNHVMQNAANPTRRTDQSLLNFSTNSTQRSLTASKRRQSRSTKSQLPRKGKPDVIPGLARDITRREQPAKLTESDSTILETESILRQLDEACQSAKGDSEQRIVISGAAQELITVWQRSAPTVQIAAHQGNIGPMPHDSPIQKARFIATLLLEIYHPQGQDDGKSLVLSNSRTDFNSVQTKPMPEVLLGWMNRYHNSFGSLLETVMSEGPNPVASDFFWDAVHTFVLRGQFVDLMRLLAEADFKHAVASGPKGTVPANFSGTQLQAIQAAIYQTRQVINACPALQENDWIVDGPDWDMYRKQVEKAIEDLTELADDQGYEDDSTQESNTLSGRRTGLPFVIYRNIKTIYNIFLGDAEVILGLSQDWLEASLLLTVWWNGSEDAKVAQWSFDVSRANRLDVAQTRENPYLTRLRDSFLCVTDPDVDSNFHVNTISPVEVGVGSILQGDVQSALKILQTFSLCVAATIAEIGTWAGWLSNASTVGFDQDDLIVLSYGTANEPIRKDDLLIKYANELFDHTAFYTTDGTQLAGWELAFSVTSRLDEPERIQTTISEFLEELPVTDPDTAEKLIMVCTDLGLTEQGCKVSRTFGDHLVNTTSQYGTALLCYARAHSEDKVRQVVDLLNSYCIVQSKVYPLEKDMDDHLQQLVSNPHEALSNITEIDPAAAEALQFYLVGYACLRKFYGHRDAEVSGKQQIKPPKLRPVARKKTASKALIAAINSAADSIYGGLYDADRRSAIQVDGLLTLLGEATALLAKDGEKRVLTAEQMYSLLAAIEDLETVNKHVFVATEECMEAAMRNFHGSQPPSPHAMLKKSVSSGTNSAFSFSMMGSEMLARSEDSFGGKSMGSAVLIGDSDIKIDRGWDWRAQFKDNASASDVIRFLRNGIARELSIATLEEGG